MLHLSNRILIELQLNFDKTLIRSYQHNALWKNIKVLCCIWNFFVNVKEALKKMRVSPCGTDVLHYRERILICLNSWLIRKIPLIRLMLRKNIQILLTFQFSALNNSLKKVRLSSCRADALNYCNRLLIRSHLNFDEILLAVMFYVEMLKAH